jgi:Flp pilus assembly protein TadG
MPRMRARSESGATAVEFALVLLPLSVIMFALVQYGLYFYSAQTGSNTVNAAVRQLSVGNCQAVNSLRDYVDKQLGSAKTDVHATPTPAWTKVDGTPASGPTDPDIIGGTVTLTISFHTINMHFPFVPFLSDSVIDRQAQARVEDAADQGCGS